MSMTFILLWMYVEKWLECCVKTSVLFCLKMSISSLSSRYNNKTYRVDDIDWEKKPRSTFKLRDGSEISYKDYYQKVWKLAVLWDLIFIPPSPPWKMNIFPHFSFIANNIYFEHWIIGWKIPGHHDLPYCFCGT
jgi:hypothetical protein